MKNLSIPVDEIMAVQIGEVTFFCVVGSFLLGNYSLVDQDGWESYVGNDEPAFSFTQKTTNLTVSGPLSAISCVMRNPYVE